MRCLASLSSVLRPLRLDVAAGLDQVEVRRRGQQVLGALVRDRVAGPSCGPRRRTAAGAAAWRSGSCCSVSWRVHSWSETIAFQGASTSLLAELDRLGQDDLLLGGQQGDLADLLEVHPDGSSIPIMSAERASSSSAVGSSSSAASSLAGASAGRTTPAASPSTETSTTSSSSSAPRSAPRAPGRARDRPRGPRRRHRRARSPPRRRRRVRRACPAASRPAGPPRSRPSSGAAGRSTASTSCLSSGSCAMSSVPSVGQAWPAVAGAAAVVGRVRRRVCSIRRSSDRRASLICASSVRRRAIASWSSRSSASACSAWFQSLRSSSPSASRVEEAACPRCR